MSFKASAWDFSTQSCQFFKWDQQADWEHMPVIWNPPSGALPTEQIKVKKFHMNFKDNKTLFAGRGTEKTVFVVLYSHIVWKFLFYSLACAYSVVYAYFTWN